MNKRFEMSPMMRIGTDIIMKLLYAGMPMGPLKLLAVRGRKSGKLYTTPVALVIKGDERWIVAAFGEVGWVKNLRASAEAQLIRGNRSENIHVSELSHAESAPILKTFLRRFGIVPFIPPYFETTTKSSLAEFEVEAQNHPVFKIVG